MTADRSLKRSVRARMARTGESYAVALRALRAVREGLVSLAAPIPPYTAEQERRDRAAAATFRDSITDRGRRQPRTVVIQIPEPVIYVCANCGWEDDEDFGQCPECDV